MKRTPFRAGPRESRGDEHRPAELERVTLLSSVAPGNDVAHGARVGDLAAQLANLTAAMRDVQAGLRALEKRIPARLVSVREAADAVGCSACTIWRKIKSGEIPHRRIGRSVRVDISKLRALDADEVAEMTARAMAR